MTQTKIKFQAVNIYVSDFERALFFYQRLGFFIDIIDNDIISIKLSRDSDFVIYLKDAHAYNHDDGDISIGLEADAEKGSLHEDVFCDLLYRGFTFSNLEPFEQYGTTICALGVLEDPDGVAFELVDNEYPVE